MVVSDIGTRSRERLLLHISCISMASLVVQGRNCRCMVSWRPGSVNIIMTCVACVAIRLTRIVPLATVSLRCTPLRCKEAINKFPINGLNWDRQDLLGQRVPCCTFLSTKVRDEADDVLVNIHIIQYRPGQNPAGLRLFNKPLLLPRPWCGWLKGAVHQPRPPSRHGQPVHV